ncbi:hypothetical protein ACC793_37105, partial [Rhizobium ruizarguesonis]
AGAPLPVISFPKPYWLKGRIPFNFKPFGGEQLDDYQTLAIVSRAQRARLQIRIFKDKTPSAYALAQRLAERRVGETCSSFGVHLPGCHA